jgi:ABC-type ATPase involved in cell division
MGEGMKKRRKKSTAAGGSSLIRKISGKKKKSEAGRIILRLSHIVSLRHNKAPTLPLCGDIAGTC